MMPEKIGVVKFLDGTFEVYPDLADVPPSTSYTRSDISEARIAELEAQISNLTQLNNSLSEQNTTLLKRMDAAMNYIKAIEGDAYKLSAVYLILNGGKDETP